MLEAPTVLWKAIFHALLFNNKDEDEANRKIQAMGICKMLNCKLRVFCLDSYLILLEGMHKPDLNLPIVQIWKERLRPIK